ncbi:hypothetical protein C8Q74DRAFT_1446790 [Fomes fomentarius]|nr:hypothetical protein C8Q74DRAFT_1446790 [Fomes fomentarius]
MAISAIESSFLDEIFPAVPHPWAAEALLNSATLKRSREEEDDDDLAPVNVKRPRTLPELALNVDLSSTNSTSHDSNQSDQDDAPDVWGINEAFMYPQDPEPSYEYCSNDTGTTYANPIEVASEEPVTCYDGLFDFDKGFYELEQFLISSIGSASPKETTPKPQVREYTPHIPSPLSNRSLPSDHLCEDAQGSVTQSIIPIPRRRPSQGDYRSTLLKARAECRKLHDTHDIDGLLPCPIPNEDERPVPRGTPARLFHPKEPLTPPNHHEYYSYQLSDWAQLVLGTPTLPGETIRGSGARHWLLRSETGRHGLDRPLLQDGAVLQHWFLAAGMFWDPPFTMYASQMAIALWKAHVEVVPAMNNFRDPDTTTGSLIYAPSAPE